MKDKNITIKLDTHVEFEGQTIKQLTMREPKVKDMLVAQSKTSNQAEVEVQMMANLTAQPSEMIEELSMKDYGKLQKQYESFLTPPRIKLMN